MTRGNPASDQAAPAAPAIPAHPSRMKLDVLAALRAAAEIDDVDQLARRLDVPADMAAELRRVTGVERPR